MTNHHTAFGLAIRSNRELGGFPASDIPGFDLEVEFADGRDPELDPDACETTAATGWGSMREDGDGGYVFRSASHGGERLWSMHVSGHGRRIEVRWRGDVELADVAYFVEVAGVATALALRGVPMLHACAVDVGAAAFLAVGSGGAGKSTLAAAAVRRGHALLSDDVAALEPSGGGATTVHVGGHLLRMHEDAAAALGWDQTALERLFVTPGTAPKRYVRLSTADGSLADGPRRAAAIFVLGERTHGPARIARLAETDALPLILNNTFGDRALGTRARARLLPFWTRLVRDVPIYAVAPSDDIARVGELVEALTGYAR